MMTSSRTPVGKRFTPVWRDHRRLRIGLGTTWILLSSLKMALVVGIATGWARDRGIAPLLLPGMALVELALGAAILARRYVGPALSIGVGFASAATLFALVASPSQLAKCGCFGPLEVGRSLHVLLAALIGTASLWLITLRRSQTAG